ncbi:hypothetical protein ACFL3D_02910 [Candidatus Omnitrophota bacterium]
MVKRNFCIVFLCVLKLFAFCSLNEAECNDSNQRIVSLSTIAPHLNSPDVYKNGKYTILRETRQLPIPRAKEWPDVISLPNLPSGEQCELVLDYIEENEFYDQETLEVGVIKKGVECTYKVCVNGAIIDASSIRFYDCQGVLTISNIYVYIDIMQYEHLNKGIGKNILLHLARHAHETGKSFVVESTQNYRLMNLIDRHISRFARYRIKKIGAPEPNIISGQSFTSFDWFDEPILVNVRFFDTHTNKIKSWEGRFSFEQGTDELYYDPDPKILVFFRDDDFAQEIVVTYSEKKINVQWRDPNRTDEYKTQIFITMRNILRIEVPWEDIFRFEDKFVGIKPHLYIPPYSTDNDSDYHFLAAA